MEIISLLLTDFYKVGHPFQYPKGTSLVYSNYTNRKSRMPKVNEVVFFGLQYFIREYLINHFNREFFGVPINVVLEKYGRRVRTSLGSDLETYQHILDLYNLGYLPLEIKAVPEGTRVPMKRPCLTIKNTIPEFYWLTNWAETVMSATIWQPITSATIAYEYKKLLTFWAEKTGMPLEFVSWQGHDFSFRGMSSVESAITSGMAHLLSFTGTDTIPAIDALEYYYHANAEEELIGGSVPATEHSVMCSGEQVNELDTFSRLISEIYPKGIVSIVSDTWDLWKVCTEYLPKLKNTIMARDGKVVIRPDSGNPLDIICGTASTFDAKTPAEKGVIQLLWETFGGTINDKGFKVLDPHVGAIYGDSITLERADMICSLLAAKGFASQMVFGIGSYTYQHNTRDTFGSAMKATYVEINGEPKNIFKNPITDDGTKFSAKGLLNLEGGNLKECCTWEEEAQGDLKTVFKDGEFVKEYTLSEIRKRLSE